MLSIFGLLKAYAIYFPLGLGNWNKSLTGICYTEEDIYMRGVRARMLFVKDWHAHLNGFNYTVPIAGWI